MSDFWKAIFYVFQGAVLAQSIPVLSYIIITRIIGPAEFGLFAIWSGLVGMGAIIATLRLENNLVNEQDDAARARHVGIVMLTILCVSIVLALLLGVVAFFLSSHVSAFSATALLLGAPALAFVAVNTSLQFWAAADGRLKNLNQYRLVQAIMVAGCLSLAVIGGFGGDGLIFGLFIGQMSAALICWARKPVPILGVGLSLRAMIEHWSRYQRFPIFTLPADAIRTFAAQVPVILVGSKFGLEMSGQLALAQRVLGLPAILIGKSISDVFRREAAADISAHGHCRPLYFRILLGMIPVSVFFIIMTFLLADVIFTTVFGQSWQIAADLALYICFIFAISFIALPLSSIIYVVQRQKIDLIGKITLLALVVMSFVLNDNIINAIFFYVFGHVILDMIYLVMSYYMCAHPRITKSANDMPARGIL